MEIMQPLHALSVHEEMELLGVMVIVYGLMKHVFQKVKSIVPSLNFHACVLKQTDKLVFKRNLHICIYTKHQ